MHRVVIFIIIYLIGISLDYYVFQAVRVLTFDLNDGLRKGIHIGYWVVSALSFAAPFLFVLLDSTKFSMVRTALITLFFANVAGKLLGSLFVFSDDVRRFALQLFGSGSDVVNGDEHNNISRSDFLATSAVIAASLPALTLGYGIVSGAHDYRVRKKTVYSPNLPTAFDGIRLAQVSDIHSGSFFNKVAVKGGVEMLMAEKPDIIFFTGDLVNNVASEVKDYINVFDKLKAPLGVHSILGNHDYGDYHGWTSEEAKRKNLLDVIEAHRLMGYNIMLNENKVISVDGESIGLIGVENWGLGFKQQGDLKKAYKDVKEEEFKILLSHDPSHWDAEVRPLFGDIDLTLSGHTHGFQFGIEVGDFKWSPSQYRYKQWAGLYQEGNQYLYVNRGYGYLGYPGRIGILPEITILELKRAI